MATFIILALIIIYAIFIIRKKVKDVKAGNFCGTCSSCPSKSKCASFDKVYEE